MTKLSLNTRQLKSQKGFTLIELLVVIGILAVLLAITLIAINPARQFQQANNTQRSSDVNAILNAVGQYMVDNNGDLSALNIPAGTPATITSAGGANTVDICAALVPTYIAELPVDPQGGSWTDCTNYNTQYTIIEAGNNRITVSAPGTEPVDTPANITTNDISVTR